MDRTVYEGPPAEVREEREMRCYRLLDSLGIAYRRVDHESAGTIEACHAVEEVLGCPICKNLFLTNRRQTDFYLLLMPGEKPFKTKLLSHQLGVPRLSFAGPEHMERLLDLSPGSVSVLGLSSGGAGAVRLLMDRELLGEAWFACHPCRNTSTLRFATRDLLEKLLPALGREPTFVDLPWETEEGP